MLRYYLQTLLSAVLFAIAVPGPLFENGSMVLGACALAPYFLVLLQCKDKHTIMRCGFVFGFVASGITYYWLVFYQNFALWTIGSMALAHGIVHIILALVFARVSLAHPLWRPFVYACLWSAFEYMTSIGYLAFPWGTGGLALTQSLLFIQHIEVTGVWTLNFMAALSSAIIAECMYQYACGHRALGAALLRRHTLCLLTMVACVLLFGLSRALVPLTIEDTVPIMIVQQNTDAWNEGATEALRANIVLTREGLQAVGGDTPRPELIVWSETSIGFPYVEYMDRYRTVPEDEPLVPFIQDMDVPLLSGSPFVFREADMPAKSYNAALLIDADTQVRDYYGKRHLVPFGEHVPFWDYPIAQKIYTNVIGLRGTWNRGNVDAIMSLEREGKEALEFGVLICFEDSFGYLGRDIARKGGRVLINLTNNSWSRRRAAQIQHLSTARLRTIETRRALVRSTNSGESVLINAYGQIEARLPSFEKGYLHVRAPIYDSGTTLYVRWGDYVGQVQMWVAVLLFVACRSRRGVGVLRGSNTPASLFFA